VELNEEDQNPRPVMPDFKASRHGYSHTVDSALSALFAAGMDPDRVTMRRAGLGWTKRRIVSQEPIPLSSIGSHDVVLSVAGEGLFERLPTGLRDRGTDSEPGLDALLEVFDDPSEKANCYVRQGGLYFDLRPDNPAGCARWIRAFGIAPEDWPAETWYALARFLPFLPDLAGREAGIRLGLKVLLGLDICRLQRKWRRTALAEDALTQIGETSARLGVDFIVGQTLEDEAVLEIFLGPVTLAEYRRHQSRDMKWLLESVLNLVLPCHVVRVVEWVVGNPEFRPRLAGDEENTVLGINMHLGERVPIHS
jgi:Type VI secretion, TssG